MVVRMCAFPVLCLAVRRWGGRVARAFAALALVGGAAFADPPDLVGRVGVVDGPVSLHPATGDEAVESPTNHPLTIGDALRTATGGRVEIEFPGVRLWLGEDGELAIDGVGDDGLRFDLRTGRVRIGLDEGASRPAVHVVAGEAAIDLRRAGDYRIDTGPAGTALVVRAGLARIEAGGAIAYPGTGQRVEVAFGGLAVPTHIDAGDAVDDFDRWVAARLAGDQPAAPRYVPAALPGWRDLDAYGTWERHALYGPIWSPSWVPDGWAPYRNGYWTWTAHWGWTWVDAAPWGFAPFHFGRWTHWGGRWCWVPGHLGPRPPFSPALVVFIDRGHPVFPRHHRGERPRHWAPLAPHETFVPAVPASSRFVDRVNASHRLWQGRDAPGVVPRHDGATVAGGEQRVRTWPRLDRRFGGRGDERFGGRAGGRDGTRDWRFARPPAGVPPVAPLPPLPPPRAAPVAPAAIPAAPAAIPARPAAIPVAPPFSRPLPPPPRERPAASAAPATVAPVPPGAPASRTGPHRRWTGDGAAGHPGGRPFERPPGRF